MAKRLNNMDELRLDVEAVEKTLREMPLNEPLADVRELVLESFAENFAESSSASGAAWPPRKPRPDDDGHPLLIETGALRAAAIGEGPGHVTRLDKREIEVGVDPSVKLGGIPGAKAHQFGYPDNNLPARPFHDPREEHLTKCDEILADYLLERL